MVRSWGMMRFWPRSGMQRRQRLQAVRRWLMQGYRLVGWIVIRRLGVRRVVRRERRVRWVRRVSRVRRIRRVRRVCRIWMGVRRELSVRIHRVRLVAWLL